MSPSNQEPGSAPLQSVQLLRLDVIRSTSPKWFILVAAGIVCAASSIRLPIPTLYVVLNLGLILVGAGIAGIAKGSLSGLSLCAGVALGLIVFFFSPPPAIATIPVRWRIPSVFLMMLWFYDGSMPFVLFVPFLYNRLSPLLPGGGLKALVVLESVVEPAQEETPAEETEAADDPADPSEQA